MIIISWFLCSCIIDGNCPIFLVIRFLFHETTDLFFYFIWNNSMAKAEKRDIKSNKFSWLKIDCKMKGIVLGLSSKHYKGKKPQPTSNNMGL